jgi:hypothetical protein
MLSKKLVSKHTPDNWIQGPENQGETSDGSEKGSSLSILCQHRTATGNGEQVNDDQVGNASHGIPSPLLAITVTISSEKSSKNHDLVCENGDENVGTVQAGEESKIEKEERSGERPVHISGPEDLAEHVHNGVGDSVLVALAFHNVGKGVSASCGHGEVGQSSKCSDEGSNDMEQSLLLSKGSESVAGILILKTYNWDSISHGGERNGRDEHDDEDNLRYQQMSVSKGIDSSLPIVFLCQSLQSSQSEEG